MPQISPMKWMILNALTQSSVLQIVSFLSMSKIYTFKNDSPQLSIKKMCWKW